MNAKPVTIVGGGLAGLTLGIALRQRGVPVKVLEAGRYPRHRVCGEFICGRGQEVLAGLGLLEPIRQAGGIQAFTARFFFDSKTAPTRRLPSPALCISRHRLDELLAERFRAAGGELHEQTSWRGCGAGEGLVLASGRRPTPSEHRWRWFGLKAHAANVELTADLEMHCLAEGYVGICRLGGNRVNVCGLFRRARGEHPEGVSRYDLLRGPTGSFLHQRLGRAQFDTESFCSVAGLPLRPQPAAGRPECCIGDALTMIAPVTGNGMSMAFEGAAIAVDPLSSYSHGRLDWPHAQQQIAEHCDAAFGRRLTWGSRLQALLLSGSAPRRLSLALLRSEQLWRMLFSRTR